MHIFIYVSIYINSHTHIFITPISFLRFIGHAKRHSAIFLHI